MIKYIRKLFTPIPLTTLAASGMTLWATGIWWILPLGVLAAGIITVQSAHSEDTESLPGEDRSLYDLTLLNHELRVQFRSLLEEKEKILNELKGKKDDAFFLNSEEISNRVDSLVSSYYDHLLKLEKIRPFIDERAIGALRKSIEDLKRETQKCTDEVTLQNLSLALNNKTDQMNRLTELVKYRDRVESQLVNLVSALNSLYVRIVHIGLSPDLDPTQEVRKSIDNLLLDVEVAEKTTREFHQIIRESDL